MSSTAGSDPLQSLVGKKDYPCVMARAVLRRGQHTVERYPLLAANDSLSMSALARELEAFAREPDPQQGFRSFVAIFGGPPPASEEAFEETLWGVLSALTERDRDDWDPGVSPNPEDPRFSFSFAGRAFYIIGLHPAASRPARRCERPTLVFNLHDQFERLREQGYFAALRSLIRERDREFSGSTNPMLADFGEKSEARQYSGRAVDETWRCPFHREG